MVENRNLDYFCFFCRSLWSSTAVHCMTCGKCVEGFDHHCVIVDNCIGFNNHGAFLNFLVMFQIYSLITLVVVIICAYIYVERIIYCIENPDSDIHPCHKNYLSMILLGVCIFYIFICILQTIPLAW